MILALIVLAAMVVAYLVAWPVPIAPRRWAPGPDPGYAGPTILFDNLPGLPDDLMRGGPSRIWCGLVKPRNANLDKIADKPILRKIALRLPTALQPIPRDYGHVFAFDDAGEVVVSLQDPSAAYPDTTSAAEFGDRLYIASLTADWIGWRSTP